MEITGLQGFAFSVVLIFVTAAVTRWFERKPKLITYVSHSASFTYSTGHGGKEAVNTHTLVIRNTGSKAATNVRVGHNHLPEDFDISPKRTFKVESIGDGECSDIVFDTVAPSEQITISYLYFPPVFADQIIGLVKSDEGIAKGIDVWLTRRFPPWVNFLITFHVVIGASTIVYFLALGLFRLLPQ